MRHKLKSWPQCFDPIVNGDRRHDLRRNDRNFQAGDMLELHEFDPSRKVYTGRQFEVEVTDITSNDRPCAVSEKALTDGFCILSIRPVDKS